MPSLLSSVGTYTSIHDPSTAARERFHLPYFPRGYGREGDN